MTGANLTNMHNMSYKLQNFGKKVRQMTDSGFMMVRRKAGSENIKRTIAQASKPIQEFKQKKNTMLSDLRSRFSKK